MKYFSRLYLKHYIIGLCRADINNIIKQKSFDYEIKWLQLNSINHFLADPFPLKQDDGNLKIFLEDFSLDDFYGKISVVTLDSNFKKVDQKILLDKKSHLSYPFIFHDNGNIYVFPESSRSNELACYKYDPVTESLNFVKVVLYLPLLDSTVLKYQSKYWIFGTLNGNDSNNKLYIFFSENLLGPYVSHPGNPVKNSLIGSRPAGNFFEIDGTLYRPAQNCGKEYGESVTINKVQILDELNFHEESYMTIAPDTKDRSSSNILMMHTLNIVDDLIIVDGLQWTFSPGNQWRFFLKNRNYARQLKRQTSLGIPDLRSL